MAVLTLACTRLHVSASPRRSFTLHRIVRHLARLACAWRLSFARRVGA